MAGKIDKLNELQNVMESEANMLKKGIEVLEYWNPFDDSKREEAREEILRIEKQISNTYKRYILLWCTIIIATVIICIKFV